MNAPELLIAEVDRALSFVRELWMQSTSVAESNALLGRINDLLDARLLFMWIRDFNRRVAA